MKGSLWNFYVIAELVYRFIHIFHVTGISTLKEYPLIFAHVQLKVNLGAV